MAPGARQSGLVLLFAGGYCAGVLAGHALSFAELKFATFWPPAGLFMATLALSPKRVWWQYLLMATALNFTLELLLYRQPLSLALIFVLANGLEAYLGALVLQHSCGGEFQFFKLRQVLELAAVSVAMPLVGAFISAWGMSSIMPLTSFGHIFHLWWQADSVGILLVAPVQIVLADWLRTRRIATAPSGAFRMLEVILLYPCIFGATWLAFGPAADSMSWTLSLNGLIFLVPVLGWAGLRFGRLGAVTASSFSVLVTIYYTTRGDGLLALAAHQPELQATSLQSFAAVTMLTPLIFATVLDYQRAVEEKLRYNLNILQSVMDNTTDLIYVKDLQGRYLLVNPACAATTQRSMSEMVGHRDLEFVAPERGDEVRQRDQLVFAAGHALTFEESVVLHGKKYTFLTTKSPYRDATGEIVGLVGLSRDISQRIEQLEALAESECRYRTLVTSSNVGIFETDKYGFASYVNPRWSQLTGRPASSATGVGWAESLHPEDRAPVAAQFAQAVKTGSEFAMEYRYVTPSGQINWVFGSAVPIRNEQGEVTGYLGNVIDVSAQKRTALELQASEERFRRLADSAPVLIWTATLEGRFNYCNRRWLAFTGRTLEQEMGHGWLQCVHAEDRERCSQTYADSEGLRSAFELDYRLLRHDGEYRWMHHVGSPKISVGGEFRGFIGSCFDITDQRRATETLVRAKEELEHHVAERTAALQDANRQLQQLLVEQARSEERLQQQQAHLAHVSRLSVMGEMAAGLAHEMNQPLFAIQNYTAGILRRWSGPEDFSPELRDVILQIAQESTRAAVIIRRVREFARKPLGERISLHLNDLICEVLQLLGSEIRGQKIDLRVALAEHLPTIRSDRVQLQQVLVNLVRNALEAMEHLPPRQRQLTISTFLAPGEVHCLVQDAGPGIPAEVRAHLFEPFFTTKPAGLGMGLSISRSIVEAHGGSLQAESSPAGAAFHFYIPLLEDQAHDAEFERADRVLGG